MITKLSVRTVEDLPIDASLLARVGSALKCVEVDHEEHPDKITRLVWADGLQAVGRIAPDGECRVMVWQGEEPPVGEEN